MSTGSQARVLAPAKINLGLEITGRRADGYHDIRSVLAMVDLNDELTFTLRGNSRATRIDGMPHIPQADNLVTRAIVAFTSRTGIEAACDVGVQKRIPAPSGLGGGSSDAAATLLVLNQSHGCPLREDEIHLLGASLGSDVPFFLGSPAALASGIGTTLAPLPAPAGWVLIVVPSLDLRAKTAALYSSIRPMNFTDGRNVERIAECIRAGQSIPTELLTNAFERPLEAIVPGIRDLVRRMSQAGCGNVALSGAGPAHYSIFETENLAHEVAQRMKGSLKPGEQLFVAPFRTSPLTVKIQ
ncbi:MAG TPA: 4-(cytidine 5'-diphospho)-2-C-methyl-D-erythritol kinase [Thermomicrobiales bacterium]|nr:4-(cytidine 5'-diphospho)-2-C-methyl-D-erythritol kinase [Thermomicrobiales bacterium]